MEANENAFLNYLIYLQTFTEVCAEVYMGVCQLIIFYLILLNSEKKLKTP